jgi:hypothetical protein
MTRAQQTNCTANPALFPRVFALTRTAAAAAAYETYYHKVIIHPAAVPAVQQQQPSLRFPLVPTAPRTAAAITREIDCIKIMMCTRMRAGRIYFSTPASRLFCVSAHFETRRQRKRKTHFALRLMHYVGIRAVQVAGDENRCKHFDAGDRRWHCVV